VTAILASAGAAGAQTTVITREPVQSRAVVATEPLQLTPVQRQTIYRTIVRERVAPAQPTIEYRVGARIPESAQLYAVPQEVAVEVPAIRAYKYMVVNNRVVLIDLQPARSSQKWLIKASHRLGFGPAPRAPGHVFCEPNVYRGPTGQICTRRGAGFSASQGPYYTVRSL